MSKPRAKQQVNASVDPAAAKRIYDICDSEGRKLGEMVERMIAVYDGSPSHLLDRLKRFNKRGLTEQDKASLREIQDLCAFLLHG